MEFNLVETNFNREIVTLLTKLRFFNPQPNYSDRATVACRGN
jgi:hypothetical protein